MTTDKRHTGELIPGGQAGIRAGWQADGKATPGWKANRQAGKQEWADRCLHEQPVTLAQKTRRTDARAQRALHHSDISWTTPANASQ